eukprot:CAMPEP_0170261726 /NCGR_PEP_ID=MMETSP0116_2-20130129/30744_1 /TAXON_ID=400756 /ORGANISM="Durinskia baltica, Strain CSIRO CS-38" /LENGTH=163 /DNA_ID=CAMNT_0010512791 /DNA_START=75 /DNA_END=566 /DNA_ORIENTATION=+
MAGSVSALLASLLALGGASELKGDALKNLMCESCHVVMNSFAKDVKYLTETGKMWKQKDLEQRLSISCSDPGLPQGAFAQACAALLEDYGKAIMRDVSARWDEDSEYFEEDIAPKEYCRSIGVCKEGHVSINQMIANSDRKEKDLKEEREAKEREKAKKEKET